MPIDSGPAASFRVAAPFRFYIWSPMFVPALERFCRLDFGHLLNYFAWQGFP